MCLTLMYITNDPQIALIAQRCGVQRIWIDLETLGKEERQKNMNTVKSNHSISDIKRIAPLMNESNLLVRINPWNALSKKEIEEVISAGADIIMLPMWKSTYEVKEFINAVNSRTKIVLLLETKEAEECLDEVLKIPGIDEIHIGLNDLHLSYGLKFMFELLSNGTIDKICNKLNAAKIPFGFGGIAKIGYGDLPAEKIIVEHYRLNSTRAILSRSFCNSALYSNYDEFEHEFISNMKKLRAFEKEAAKMSPKEYEDNKCEVKKIVSKIINLKAGE